MDVRIRRAVGSGEKATILVLALSYFDDQGFAIAIARKKRGRCRCSLIVVTKSLRRSPGSLAQKRFSGVGTS